MPWPKGRARGWLATPPSYLAGMECNAQELTSPRLGRRTVQAITQAEIIEHVESGGHLVAERYSPGQRELAERAYMTAKGFEGARLAGLRASRMATPNWIKTNCADLLADRSVKRMALVGEIKERMRAAHMDIPGDSSLFRYLTLLLGKKVR